MKPRANHYKIDRIAYEEPIDPAWYWDLVSVLVYLVVVVIVGTVVVMWVGR